MDYYWYADRGHLSMSNVIHLIFTPKGPKVCFLGLTAEEVHRKFENKDSKHHVTGGTIRESQKEVTVYLQRN